MVLFSCMAFGSNITSPFTCCGCLMLAVVTKQMKDISSFTWPLDIPYINIMRNRAHHIHHQHIDNIWTHVQCSFLLAGHQIAACLDAFFKNNLPHRTGKISRHHFADSFKFCKTEKMMQFSRKIAEFGSNLLSEILKLNCIELKIVRDNITVPSLGTCKCVTVCACDSVNYAPTGVCTTGVRLHSWTWSGHKQSVR